jgi:ketosteroid isomerase-like protein
MFPAALGSYRVPHTVSVGGRVRVGLLFQPRRSAGRHDLFDPTATDDRPRDRPQVFLAALEAVVLGDASRFGELFTDDVVFSSPHLTVASLAMVQRGLGSPEDSLTDVDIVVVALDTLDDKVIAEWRLEALFTRPVLYDDRFLIEPTGAGVRLPGMSVAEFRGYRIAAFRHYFDDSALLAGATGVPSHLRWTQRG